MPFREGPEPEVKYCPACKSDIQNIPRTSEGYTRTDGTVSPDSHRFKCPTCGFSAEINIVDPPPPKPPKRVLPPRQVKPPLDQRNRQKGIREGRLIK